MRLIAELCKERGLSAIINIHDVMLAQMFAERIVGLRLGEVVYDGPPDGLTSEVFTEIYVEEVWEATIRRADEDEDAGYDDGGGEVQERKSVPSGQSVSCSVDFGCRRILQNKNRHELHTTKNT